MFGQGRVQGPGELFEVERLDEGWRGGAMDRFQSAAERGIARDQDHLGLRRGGVDVVEEIDARDVGQLKIHDGDVHGRLLDETLEGLLALVRGPDSMPPICQDLADRGAQSGIVVDHENVSTVAHEYLPKAQWRES